MGVVDAPGGVILGGFNFGSWILALISWMLHFAIRPWPASQPAAKLSCWIHYVTSYKSQAHSNLRKGRPGSKNIDPSDPSIIRSWKQISAARPMCVLSSMEDSQAKSLQPNEPFVLRIWFWCWHVANLSMSLTCFQTLMTFYMFMFVQFQVHSSVYVCGQPHFWKCLPSFFMAFGHTTLFNVFLMSLSWVMSKVLDDTLCAIFAQTTTKRRSCWTQPWPSFESLWTLLLMTDQCTLPSVWTRFDSDKSLTRETRGSEATCVDVGSNSTWKSKLSSCVHQMKIQTHLSFVKLNFEQIQSTTLIRRSAVAVAHSLFA